MTALERSVIIILAGIGILFLSTPIAVLGLHTLQSQAWQTLGGSVVLDAIYVSLLSTTITVLLAILFGTPLAYVLARWRFTGRRTLNVLIELPIVLPPAVAGLALLLAFGSEGVFGPLLEQINITLPFTIAAVVIAQTFVAAPFYMRAAQVGFQGVARDIEDAARVDGADGTALFFFVTMPLSARALAAGLVLCWARALGEFGATILFAGSLQGATQTMPLLIYNIIERDIDAAITTGFLLVCLALVALLISQWLQRGDDVITS